jgi:hypothetical protein
MFPQHHAGRLSFELLSFWSYRPEKETRSVMVLVKKGALQQQRTLGQWAYHVLSRYTIALVDPASGTR